MTLKRVLTSLASLLLVLYAQAADIVTVTGEFTYYGSKTESRADCERAALNGARAKALAESRHDRDARIPISTMWCRPWRVDLFLHA